MNSFAIEYNWKELDDIYDVLSIKNALESAYVLGFDVIATEGSATLYPALGTGGKENLKQKFVNLKQSIVRKIKETIEKVIDNIYNKFATSKVGGFVIGLLNQISTSATNFGKNVESQATRFANALKQAKNGDTKSLQYILKEVQESLAETSSKTSDFTTNIAGKIVGKMKGSQMAIAIKKSEKDRGEKFDKNQARNAIKTSVQWTERIMKQLNFAIDVGMKEIMDTDPNISGKLMTEVISTISKFVAIISQFMYMPWHILDKVLSGNKAINDLSDNDDPKKYQYRTRPHEKEKAEKEAEKKKKDDEIFDTVDI